MTLIINISINEVRPITRKKHYFFSQAEGKRIHTDLFLYISLKEVWLSSFVSPSADFQVLSKLVFPNFINSTFITSQEHNLNSSTTPLNFFFSNRGEESQESNLNFNRICSFKIYNTQLTCSFPFAK